MKKLALMAVNTWLSCFLVSLEGLASIMVILGALESVHAADFFCSSGNVTCLIAAIKTANGNGQENTINLQEGEYMLQAVDNNTDGPNGLPSITGKMTIRGGPQGGATIERDAGAPAFRIVHVARSAKLSLDALAITGGQLGNDSGAGLYNLGTVDMANSYIISNRSGLQTGGIFNTGNLNVRDSAIENNVGDRFGGIHNFAGALFITNSTIANNGAFLDIGGLGNEGGIATISNTTLSGNGAEGIGGISNQGGEITIVSSTIANSIADFIPAISNSLGIVRITNGTISGNRGSPQFGRLFAVTGGVSNNDLMILQNTILAGNTDPAPDNAPDCRGAITSLGNNLIGDLSGCTLNLQPSDLTGDPGLGAFTNNGVPGRGNFPLLSDSRAIDAANPGACLNTDQLGNPRVGNCDMGAVEFQGMLVSIDIRPRSDANRINPNSTKEINVAILSANGFDARTIDPNTIRFGATGTEAAPVHVGRRDVDGDGDRDVVVRFQIQDTGIKCGDTSAVLTGQISGGPSVIGSSSIRTVQCGK